jgi:hypothetical protein
MTQIFMITETLGHIAVALDFRLSS